MFKQIVSVTNLLAIIESKDGDIRSRRILALGLREDGEVVPLLHDGKEIVDANNCAGFVEITEGNDE